ncbi:Alpha-1,2-mannosyltransferase ALG9 [Halotydeus destructor]|nr:Alpha-1,2-mannosyltransferase ALG9 [Halotydeus destructor]
MGAKKPAFKSKSARAYKQMFESKAVHQSPDDEGDQTSDSSSESTLGDWTLPSVTAFKILLSARLCSAIWSNISDCDETFNYWEPTHYLLYGSGLQTWEYSPLYAIRSYAYLWLYAAPAYVYNHIVNPKKMFVFYFVRCLLALSCAGCELYFYKGVNKTFGPRVARLTLFFLVLGTGMFISATAFLPSTFSMYFILLAYGSWLQQNYKLSIIASGINAILGWPFAGLLSIPIALDLCLVKRKFYMCLKYGAIFGTLIAAPVIAVDSFYYGKPVFASLNIVLYNVFSKHGANLYGTEPWHFYLYNGILNWNLAFVFSLMSLPVSVIIYVTYLVTREPRLKLHDYHWTCLGGLLLWGSVFIIQAHKEERFLFPVYPLIGLTAAFCLDSWQKLVSSIKLLNKLFGYLLIVILATFAVLSVSRSVLLFKAYHGAMDVYLEVDQLNEQLPAKLKEINLCVGKEWHRFPSSFFLPDERWKLQFIKSNFGGQLPKPFPSDLMATRLIPTEMNDLNKEEHSRYVNLTLCDYLIDSDYPNYGGLDLPYSKMADFEAIASLKFLDSQSSPSLWRAFYVPYVHETKCSYIMYNLLRRKG